MHKAGRADHDQQGVDPRYHDDDSLLAALWRVEHPHRPADVLDLLLAQIFEADIEFAGDIGMHPPGNTDPAGIGETFEAGSQIHPVAENIPILDNDVALMDADAKFDAFGRRDVGVAFGHCALHSHGVAHRIDDAGEFDQHPVAGRLDDAALMLSDFRVAELTPDPPQRCEGPLLSASISRE
jgi:hypothetical protein